LSFHFKRYAKYLPPLLGLILLTAIIFGLHRALERVSVGAVLAALRATPGVQIFRALGLVAVGCGFMAIYDLPGVLFAKRSIAFPWIGIGHVWFASFCAYSLSHVLGAPTISGTAIRVRLYAQWGVPAPGIARIITLIGTTFPLGTATLLGGILLFDPMEMPLFGNTLSIAALRGIGFVLWAVIAAYVVAAQGKAPLVLFKREVQRPGLALAVGQIVLSCADTSTACGVLYVVLPAAPGLDFSHLLAIYLAGFAGGMFSGLPGGVGVLDTVLLLGLSAYMPAPAAIGAILIYRILYYLLPAAIGAVIFASHEIFITARGARR
jgi:uncharacterized membrane protein YbhN (UPF0104 family)